MSDLSPSLSPEESEYWDDIHDLQTEIYGGYLDLGHVGAGTFAHWLRLNPDVARLDLISAVRLFEEYVKTNPQPK
jgi:hypothetical protein